jgi:hypothetical protein
MKMDARELLAPLLALAVLAMVFLQTSGAMRRSGVWRANVTKMARVRAEDPYVALDRHIAEGRKADTSPTSRDPFGFVQAAPLASGPVRPRKPAVPPPPPRPQLTAIVWDADPRALVHWNDRDYTIRTNDLFDVFRVVSITREQVVLQRGSESVVLKRPNQGD